MDINTTDKVQVRDSSTTTGTSTTWYCPYNRPKAEQGWECPRCGRINAPWKSSCDCSRNNWTITSDWTYKPEWWKEITCNSNVLKAHPDTTIWKTSSSICQSDSATVANPNITTYVTGHNSIVGGSDYQDEVNKTWTNIPNVSNNVTREDSPWNKYFTLTSDKINELQTQINNLKETK